MNTKTDQPSNKIDKIRPTPAEMSVIPGPTPSWVRWEAAKDRLRDVASQKPALEIQWCNCRTVIQSMSRESMVEHYVDHMRNLNDMWPYLPTAAGVTMPGIDSFEEESNNVIFLMHEAMAREQNAGAEGDSSWGPLLSMWRWEIQDLLEYLDNDVTTEINLAQAAWMNRK